MSLLSRCIHHRPLFLWSSTRGYRTIGIRREDKSIWERRAPLTPQAVQRLIQETGTSVYVQPSTKRIFSDIEYAKAGAAITDDLSPADIILGIKEVPVSALIPNKTYLFFSHTHKGRTLENMPMLQAIVDRNIHLVDYELMKDPATGKRLVAFGQFAGNAGMVDVLHGMGRRFLRYNHNTPFLYLASAFSYPDLTAAKLAVRNVGAMIADRGTPSDFGPLIYAFTGSGNVTKGAMEVFKELPHEFVPPEDVVKLAKDKNPRLNKVYATQVLPKDYVQATDGSPLTSYEDYLAHPDRYRSVFAEKIAPYIHCLITGAYWDKRYPRLLDNAQLRRIQEMEARGDIGKGRMMCLGDIVCDVRGAVECLSHTTSIDDPFYYYDAIRDQEHKSVEGPGIQVMGVDILPAELPLDSSNHFSSVLYPHVKALSLGQCSEIIKNATIAENGRLVKKHQHLSGLLPKATARKKQTVLLLGSGMVAAPLVNRLVRRPNTRVVVASNVPSSTLVAGHEQAESVVLDIQDKKALSRLVAGADVVVSLVPAFLHAQVAEACIGQRKHMVTASYVSEEMQKLDDLAKKADIVIMNEVGLDPGIDHMSAMKIMDEAKAKGKKIKSFISWCGGLPAPEASNVPLGYKFSWSPRGVLTASGNDAIYWAKSKPYRVSGDVLLKNHFPTVQTPFQGFAFEGLANRNALSYRDVYHLGELKDMETLFRGTLRYKGYSDLLYAFKKLGFLDLSYRLDTNVTSWKQFVHKVVMGRDNNSSPVPLAALADKLDVGLNHPLLERTAEALEYLLSDNQVPFMPTTPLDAFSMLLADRLRYKPNERDMVAMHHEFGLLDPSTGVMETATSTLIQYGDPSGDTAMATTVGLPAAMATELVLDGRVPERGVLRPTMPHVYLPILDALASEYGIRFVETVRATAPSEFPEAVGSGVWNRT